MEEIISQVLVLIVVVYGLLLVVGAPFSAPKLANSYAKWIVGLPFRIVSRFIFGKKKKSRKRRR